MIPPVRAILFDVLHTLVDDSGFPRFQLRRLLADEGIDLEEGEFEEVYQTLSKKEYDWEAAAEEEPFRSIRDRHRSRLTALYEHFGWDEQRDLERDIELLWQRIATSGLYPEVSRHQRALSRGVGGAPDSGRAGVSSGAHFECR